MIEVQGLTKSFGGFTAVDGISFEVGPGEVFGLLGPNGAGKTTTIRCLLTLVPATGGRATVAGFDVAERPQQVREASGYVPQDVSVDGDLTGYENLLLYARLFHVPRSARRARIAEILAFLGLEEKAHQLARYYSGGQMRRLEIGQVLVNRPRVLFLDEPSLGLDPAAKRVVWGYVERLRTEFGASVLLTTHDMAEADHLSDRIAILNGGRIAVTGTPAALKAALGGDVVRLASPHAGCRGVLEELGYRLLPPSEEGTCDVVVDDGGRRLPEILGRLRDRGVDPGSVALEVGTLDDVFLAHAGKRIGEGDMTWRGARAVRRTARRHGG